MTLKLQNKAVLITGSTDGLGKVLAEKLSKEGAKVTIHGKDEDKVNTVVSKIEAIKGIVCDFNKPETVANAFSEVKQLDILINNAGVWLEGDTIEATPERIQEVVNVNLSSQILTTRTLLPILLKSEFAQILNVVSVAGIEIPFDYYHTVYSATKFGLGAFTEAMVKEFDNKNLRVMAIYPGGMETELFKKAGNDYQKHEPWMFDPKETAEAILFMLTRDPKVNIKRLDLINHLQK